MTSSPKCARQPRPSVKAASSMPTKPRRWKRKSAKGTSDGRSCLQPPRPEERRRRRRVSKDAWNRTNLAAAWIILRDAMPRIAPQGEDTGRRRRAKPPMNAPLHETTLPTLRLLTCGSVDDGKSTLIGRLLYEKKLIFDDQLSALERDSKKFGTTGNDVDYALLVDGLEAEREQGITIDVAYRYFATARRSFIVADTPGHEQYTRNMATGASNADLAVILIDARKGVLTQTKRHSYICSLLGVRHVVLAVNKIDLAGYDQVVFDGIVAEYLAFAEGLNFDSITPVPLSARFGDNVTVRS